MQTEYASDFDNMLSDFVMYADRSKIAQIIRNLLSNALKFTKKGSAEVKVVTVRIHCVSSGGEQCNLEVCVVDNGPGISKVSGMGKLDIYWKLRRRFGNVCNVTQFGTDIYSGFVSGEPGQAIPAGYTVRSGEAAERRRLWTGAME
jgi:signal transduction histidine kinase